MDYVVFAYRNLIARPVDVRTLPRKGLGAIVEDLGLDDLLDSLDMAPFEEAGTDIRLHLSATGIGRVNIFERIEVGEDEVLFRLIPRSGGRYATRGGIFLEAHSGSDSFPQGALLLRRYAEPGPDQVFREIWLREGGVALETPFGTFVTAENDGKVSEIVVDRDVIGDWQRFEYQVPPEGLLPPPAPVERAESIEDKLRDSLEREMIVDVARIPVASPGDVRGLLDSEITREASVVSAAEGPFAGLIDDESPQREVRRFDTQP